MRCANCGKGVFSAVQVCPFCGETLAASTRNGPKQTSSALTAAKKRTIMKFARWQMIVACAVIIAGLTPFIVLWTTSGVVDPIVRQLDDFKRDDLQAAYGEMSIGFHQEISFEKFSEFVKSHPALSHNVAHSFTSRSSSSFVGGAGMGEVKGSITDDHGAVLPVRYGLVKENGTWRIKVINLGRQLAAQTR
jgi:hypothetical protein